MIKNLFFNIGSKALVILCQFIALIITNHIIGPEGRGIFIAAITWGGIFFIFTHLSFATGILNLSNKKFDSVYDLAYLSTLAALVMGLISVVCTFIIYRIYPPLFNNLNINLLILSVSAIPFMMLQQYSMAAVQVKGNFRAFNILYASYAFLNLTGVITLWLMKRTTVDLLVTVNLAAWSATGVISLFYLRPFIIKSTRSYHLLGLLVKTSLSAHIGAIVSFIVSRSDILVVNYFSSQKDTGIYGLAVGIVQMLLIIPLSMQNLLYYGLIGKPVDYQKKLLLQYSRITFAVMFLCALAVLLFSRPLVYLVGGKSFEQAIPLFRYLLPAVIFYSMPMVLATQWNIMGIFRQINLTAVFVLVISVTANILLVPVLGITGAAITFLAISIIAFSIHIWFVKKNLGETTISEIILIKPDDIISFLKRNL